MIGSKHVEVHARHHKSRNDCHHMYADNELFLTVHTPWIGALRVMWTGSKSFLNDKMVAFT